MTPKEKALELVGKMCLNDCTDKNIKLAKKCALIAVDEIVEIFEFMVVASNLEDHQLTAILNYWDTVKEQIEKL